MKKRLFLYFMSLVLVISFAGSGNVSAIDKIDCNNPDEVAAYMDFAMLQDIPFWDPCSDTSCQTSSSVVTQLTGADNREKIYNYFVARGLTPQQAAGVTGNIQNESGFSPTRQEESQNFPFGGWGIVQWTYGRRNDPEPTKGVVAYLNTKIPDVMKDYYKDSYGGGVSESNKFIPKGIDESINDQLLLHELDFLYKESNQREISQKTATVVGGVSAGDSEWSSLAKQTSIKGASDLWVYNFEIPANIETTAAERVQSGQTIFDLYTGGISTSEQCSGDNGPLRTQIVSLAEKELAAWETGTKKPGDHLEYTYGVNDEWCAWFVSWIYKDAGYPVNNDPKPFYSFVGDLVEMAKADDSKFEWHQNNGGYIPRPGDIAVYGDETFFYHTNIVISATSASSITTIGGNEGDDGPGTSPATRGVVKSKDSSFWASEAYGYISPKGN